MVHHHHIHRGVVIIGFCISLLLLTITIYASLSVTNGSYKVSESIIQPDRSEAKSKQSQMLNSPLPLHSIVPENEKFLEDIDTLYTYEEQLE